MDQSPQFVILSAAMNPVSPAGASAGSFAVLRMTVSWICRLPARAASGLIWVYQRTVSPALVALNPTFGCRFAPTCSHYARAALQEHGLVTGLGLTLRRLAKCGPWHPGGVDPVPPARLSCVRVRPAAPAES